MWGGGLFSAVPADATYAAPVPPMTWDSPDAHASPTKSLSAALDAREHGCVVVQVAYAKPRVERGARTPRACVVRRAVRG